MTPHAHHIPPHAAHDKLPARPAFTLIELLVVISIIALLIAILLPALAKARTASHASVSLSNLRQLSISQINYAHDQKDSMMYYRFNKPLSSFRPYWGGWLHYRNYVTSRDVFWSPARDISAIDFSISINNGNNWATFTGYGMNRGLSCEEEAAELGTDEPLKLYEQGIPPHSQFLLLAEVWTTDPGFTAARGKAGNSWAESHRTSIHMFSYNSGVPRSYLDGHANMQPGNTLAWEVINGPVGAWIGSTSGSAATNNRKKEPWYKDWR